MLNHPGERVFDVPNTNFLVNHSPAVFALRKGHEHDASLRQWYERRVWEVFAADPEFAEKLARFAW